MNAPSTISERVNELHADMAGHVPYVDFGINAAWLTASMTGQILLAWLKLLALDGDLAKAEPKTVRPVN